jgi:hypothetical protein
MHTQFDRFNHCRVHCYDNPTSTYLLQLYAATCCCLVCLPCRRTGAGAAAGGGGGNVCGSHQVVCYLELQHDPQAGAEPVGLGCLEHNGCMHDTSKRSWIIPQSKWAA